MASRVVPEMGLTIVRLSSRMALMREDLPTFGRPTTASLTGGLAAGWSRRAGGRNDSVISTSSEILRPCSALTRIEGSKPEARELGVHVAMLIRINLVDDQHDRLADPAQPSRQFRIDGSEAVLAIDHEEDHFGGLQRQLDLRVDLFGEIRVHVAADAAGIDNGKRMRPQSALGHDPVPCYPRLIVNDGNFAARQPVEERGFTHIRAPDNGGGARRDMGAGSGGHGVGEAIRVASAPASPCIYRIARV